jgi:hypothetical protein
VSRNEQQALGEGTITETSITEKQMWSALWKLNVMPSAGFLVESSVRYSPV